VVARRGRFLALFGAVLLPLVVFGFLAVEVRRGAALPGDRALLLALHACTSPPLDAVMVAASVVGAPWPMLVANLAIGAVLVRRRHRADALFLLLASSGAMSLNVAAKALFARLRPDVWASISPEDGFSFPSGHAMGSMALGAGLLVVAWPTRWRWPVLVAAGTFVLCVGVSRAYLGVHYPSDIVAGWCASLAWVVGVDQIRSGIAERWLRRNTPLLPGVPRIEDISRGEPPL